MYLIGFNCIFFLSLVVEVIRKCHSAYLQRICTYLQYANKICDFYLKSVVYNSRLGENAILIVYLIYYILPMMRHAVWEPAFSICKRQ